MYFAIFSQDIWLWGKVAVEDEIVAGGVQDNSPVLAFLLATSSSSTRLKSHSMVSK